MKIFRSTLLVLSVVLLHLSCQRELYFDGVSNGFLKKDGAGNCLPVTATGLFIIDSVLTNSNYIDVQAEVVQPGTFEIKSDTVNGISFRGTGKVSKGINTIRLFANGKPKIAGEYSFRIVYGSSFCNFKVKVSTTPFAEFILVGSPYDCAGVYVNGAYVKDSALNSLNQITLLADVTRPGKYIVNASTTNGFLFSGSGTFTAAGVQNITLTGTGTPLKADTTKVTVKNTISSCDLNIVVFATVDNKAMFSFDGTPGICAGPVIAGDYYAGIVTTVNNTAIMKVNVTKTGVYSINTNPANGLTFNAAGMFSFLGPQTVTLYASGTPTKSESTAFIPNTGTQTCNYYVDVKPLPPPAVFTLSGAPNSCAPITINGFYIHSKPLDNANTVVVQVDVTTPGAFTLSTNTINGFGFTASGVFAAAGLQNVILRGSGVPIVQGTTTITPRTGASFCNFSVTVQ
ncbi:MAG: hypothetical protein WCI49_09825 [Ferruginibacter sp.]